MSINLKQTLAKACAITGLSVAAAGAQSEIFWSNISLTYLNGSEYTNPFPNFDHNLPVGEKSNGQVYTFEHAGAYHFGKSFFFLDRFNSGDKVKNSDNTYTELGVDISVSWLGQTKLENDAIKDLYFTTQWENANPEGLESEDNILAGAGVRWKIPGFTFFDTNLYYRMNENLEENLQLTTAWSLPFEVAGAKLTFDGFFDWTTPTETLRDVTGDGNVEDYEMTFHAQPQLKLDVGHFFDKSGQYYAGIELDYWKNKLGQKDQDQTSPQFLVQVNF